MSQWALRAMILIAVDTHDGQWRTLSWLAERTMAPASQVWQLCDELVAAGQMQGAVIDGQPCFGVHVPPAEEALV